MKQYWNGALSGLLAGLAIGYLTAPQAGKKTCQKLADTIEEQTSGLALSAKEQWNKTLSMVGDLVDNVRTEAGVFADKAQNTPNTVKNQANSPHQ